MKKPRSIQRTIWELKEALHQQRIRRLEVKILDLEDKLAHETDMRQMLQLTNRLILKQSAGNGRGK